MRSRSLSLLALFLTATIACAQNDAQKEQAKFQGTWALESAVAEGKEIPSEVIKVFKMTFKDNTYRVTIGQEKIEGTFRIDPSKTPKTIDILPDDGPDRGRVQAGIYEFDGDKLKICGAQPGKDRPTTFETKDKMGYTLLILRKVK